MQRNGNVLPLLMGMMFVQFFIWGAWYVTAPSYLGTIGFAAEDFKWTYSAGPIAGMISPLLVGMIADRYFAAQRVLGVLHLAGAGLMYYATTMMQASQPDPTAINWVIFAYMLCYFPTLALTNTLAMRNIDDTEKQFPRIRVFGTLGWIAAGLALTAIGWGASIDMFFLTAGASAALGVYSFFLPHTPPVPSDEPVKIGQLFGLDALGLLKNRSYAVFMLCSFLICIPLAFYYQLAERTVQAAGDASALGDAPFKMTFGQMSEVFFMAVMPWFFVRLGVKWMLAVGMLAWVVRYLLFMIGTPDDMATLVILGVVLHGICYDFFFVTGQIYTDKFAPEAVRGQAQGLLVLFTLGLGMFVGAQVAGESEAAFTPELTGAKLEEVQSLEGQAAAATKAGNQELADQLTLEAADAKLQAYNAMDWESIWLWPALGAAAVLVLFVILFRHREEADVA